MSSSKYCRKYTKLNVDQLQIQVNKHVTLAQDFWPTDQGLSIQRGWGRRVVPSSMNRQLLASWPVDLGHSKYASIQLYLLQPVITLHSMKNVFSV